MPSPAPPQGHAIEACFNNGWADDPAWKIVCECSWECWDKRTEDEARQAHFFHAHLAVEREEVNEPGHDPSAVIDASGNAGPNPGPTSVSTDTPGSLTSSAAGSSVPDTSGHVEWADLRDGDEFTLLVLARQEGLVRERRTVVKAHDDGTFDLAEGARVYRYDPATDRVGNRSLRRVTPARSSGLPAVSPTQDPGRTRLAKENHDDGSDSRHAARQDAAGLPDDQAGGGRVHHEGRGSEGVGGAVPGRVPAAVAVRGQPGGASGLPAVREPDEAAREVNEPDPEAYGVAPQGQAVTGSLTSTDLLRVAAWCDCGKPVVGFAGVIRCDCGALWSIARMRVGNQ